MASSLHIMVGGNGIYSRELNRGQHGFDTAADVYSLTEPAGSRTGLGAESAVYDCLILTAVSAIDVKNVQIKVKNVKNVKT